MNPPARAANLAAKAIVEHIGPPRPPFTLSVGVTGHRADVLPADCLAPLRERIAEILVSIAEAGDALLKSERACFAPGQPRLRFVSPIADGADQIAAEVALDLGWELQTVLPFARAEYRASLANDDARDRFDALLERAACVLELPGDRNRRARCLCDDRTRDGRPLRHTDRRMGRPSGARTRGHRRSRPARAHPRHGGRSTCRPTTESAPRLLWSAFDPTVLTIVNDAGGRTPARPSGH